MFRVVVYFGMLNAYRGFAAESNFCIRIAASQRTPTIVFVSRLRGELQLFFSFHVFPSNTNHF